MIREEILEILDLFNEYGLSEAEQKKIFTEGIYFDFTYGDPDYGSINRILNVFGVGILLKTCKENNIVIDVSEMIKFPWNFNDIELIHEVADEQNKSFQKKIKIRRLGNER